MSGRPLLPSDLEALVIAATGASSLSGVEVVQELWSGYGQILRCGLEGASTPSVIVKHVRWPERRHHPRGWATDRSHERKLRSYEIETAWYGGLAQRCGPGARVPGCLAVERRPDGVVLVLEDLDAAGYPERRGRLADRELDACLGWLATFHATFLGTPPDGLWPVGTYWHLDTRPDELAALVDGPLKSAAAEIDRRLRSSPFQTLVHGDAKVANFCFAPDDAATEPTLAAVDFQYVGGGCGMQDLAYFLGSCLDEHECELLEGALLDRYFVLLRSALAERSASVDLDALEADWRALYPVAWTDFSRFLQGWSPGHWKLHRYTAQLEAEVLAALDEVADP